MDVLNNRYRVVFLKNHSHFVSSYVVHDMLKNYEVLELNILNSEYLTQDIVDILSKEFITYTEIVSDNIIKDDEFDLIDIIDNKKLSEKQYYYTCKYYENCIDFFDFLNTADQEQLLKLFLQILSTVNFIHLKGINYGAINPDNIYIYKSEDGYTIKLKDIASAQIEKNDYWGINSKYIYYLSPETLSEKQQNVLSDIYSLGVLLLQMCIGKDISETGHNLDEFLSNYEFETCYKKSNSLYERIKPVIYKMLSSNPENRYQNIKQIADDINRIFGRSFNILNLSELERISFYTKICGRDYEINKVVNIYEMLKNHQTKGKIVLVHGEEGIGKTRFLQELRHIFRIKRTNLYWSFSIDSSSKNSSRAIIEILRKMIADSDPALVKKYEMELSVFIPEMINNNFGLITEALSGDKGKFRVLNGVFSFINEFANNKPIIFMIDNIHFADDYSIELLEFIFARYNKNDNIMFIASYCDTEIYPGSKFSEIIGKIIGKSGVSEIILRELSVQDSAEMVRCILNAKNVYKLFSARIYSLTYGNPLFIQEVIKNLFAKRIIFINPNLGVWDSNYNDDYNELPLPTNMEQAVLSQTKDINDIEQSILNVISIFNSGAALEDINTFIFIDETETANYIDKLINKGLLCKKIEDNGFVYDFYNKVLKNLIYSRIDEAEKVTLHKRAAELLESHTVEGRDDSDEIIYHYQKSGDKQKVISYCIENARCSGQKRNRGSIIKNMEKAVSMFDKDSVDIQKIEILIRIGDIYTEEGNPTKSIEYYSKAAEIASKSNEKYIGIDCLNKIAEAYYDKNDMKNSEVYLNRVEKIVKKEEYLKGYLICMRLRTRVMLKKQDYARVYEIINDSLEICPEEYSEIKGGFYNNLGNLYIETSRIEEALESYEECIKHFEKTNYIKGIINGLNNLGVIYGDYYQDECKALEYYLKIKELSEKYNYITSQAHTLVNIAELYFNCFDYELAYKYFSDALEMSIQAEYESNVFYCYNYLSISCVKLKKYSKAFEYFSLVEKELENYPDHGREIGVYYHSGAELFLDMGRIDDAREFINKALEIYSNEDSLTEWDCKIIKEYINIIDKKYDNIDENISNIKYLVDRYKNVNKKIDTFLNLCIMLVNGQKEYVAAEVYRSIGKFNTNRLPNVVRLKKAYIEGIFENNKYKLDMLLNALEISKSSKCITLNWEIYYSIGEMYYEKKNYFYSSNYYFEAFEIVRNLVAQVPDEYKLDFVNFNKMFRPYNRLIQFERSSEYENKKISDQEADSIVDIENMLDYRNFLGILENKLFIKSAKSIYMNALPKKIRDVKDIVSSLSSDVISNMELLTRYMSGIALASNVMIILDSPDKGYYCIASSSGESELPDNRHIIDMVKAIKEPEIISNGLDKKNKDNYYIHNSIKSLICIPIISNDKLQKDEYKKERRKRNLERLLIKGYIYMESDRILNNFNEGSLKKCMQLTGLVELLIDKYQLKISSTVDKLTGTLSRKALEDTISMLIDNNTKNDIGFSILMFDLDHFKNINDKCGHQMGDTALKRVCEIAMDNIRSEDSCGRYGGEEFIIVLPDVDTNEAYNISEKIRTKIDEDKILGDKLPVTISIGIASFPIHGQSEHELIQKADQALYVAKELGRNRSQVWSSEFSNYKKSTNKLTGIISGNVVEDSRNVLVITELIELIKSESTFEDKIFNVLGRVIEITEAQNGVYLEIRNNIIAKKYGRKIFVEEWADIKNYNIDIINSVLIKKQGIYMIDWDEIAGYDSVTGIPDWHSIIVSPVIKNGRVCGILYLTVSTKLKEFKFDDFNFVGTLGQLIAAML